jgi:hypothetical protein
MIRGKMFRVEAKAGRPAFTLVDDMEWLSVTEAFADYSDRYLHDDEDGTIIVLVLRNGDVHRRAVCREVIHRLIYRNPT